MAVWNPWHGCHKYSEGCKFCYIHKGDNKRGKDTNDIILSENWNAPIQRKKSGEYKIKSGELVFLCFQSDFLLEEADIWRKECWNIIKERTDLHFLFLTKRIERIVDCIPNDWGMGYENVTVCCTIENQERADQRLAIFNQIPAIHKNVVCQPLLEKVQIEKYLNNIELVVVGGESDRDARILDYEWVLDIREQCIRTNTHFEFRQCGTHFIKDGKQYDLSVRDLCSQARKANINC